MKKSLPAVFLFIVFLSVLHAQGMAQEKAGNTSLVITPAVTKALIDSLRQSLTRNYIFPDTAQKWVAALEREFKKGAYANIKDPNELARQLYQDLQKAHHDGHFNLFYNPDFAKRLSDTTGAASRQKAEVANALAETKKRNYFFTKAEILQGNIGYVVFTGFTGFVKEATPTFTNAFGFVANTNALIIDLRYNGGGSPDMVNQVESYFFSTKTHLNDIVDRLAGKKIVYWTDPAKANGVILQMPVYILTSRGTFSGAEDFTYGMQSVKRAVVVGDTSGGGAHPVSPFSVGLGFVANIPFARSLNPYTNTDWEGTGVIPDIPVASDKALEAAENAIFSEKLKDAKTEEEKKKIKWQLNYIKAMQSEAMLDSAALVPFTGVFQRLDFYVRGHDLYCKNGELGNAIFKLHHISGNEFVLDENVEVEFLKNEAGTVTGLNMNFNHGGTRYKSKDKEH